MENKKFEDGWRKALEAAETTPSDGVWSGVESNLIAAENLRMKHNIVVYQRVAAVSTFLVLMLGSLAYYYWKESSDNRIQTQDILKNKGTVAAAAAHSGSKQLTTKEPFAQQQSITSQAKVPGNVPGEKEQYKRERDGLQLDGAVIADKVERINQVDRKAQVSFIPAVDLTTGNEHRSIEPVKVSMEVSPMVLPLEIGGLEVQNLQHPFSVAGADDDKIVHDLQYRETLWLAVGASTGNYNPGGASIPTYNNNLVLAYPFGKITGTSHASLGTANSVGITLARRIAGRWVVQGGVTYMNQSLGYISNIVSTSSSMPTASLGYPTVSSVVTTTNPYQINSTLQFISVPVQAGYLLVDRRVGLQLNAGGSTDFFIRNTLRDQSGKLATYSQAGGSDSPYRSVNWAGLLSTELSYKLAAHYRLSLVPGMRYSFNSALKSDSGHPSVLDIGFRFRYIMR
jgi:hypothetical protein